MTNSYITNDREIKDWLWEMELDTPRLIRAVELDSENFYPILESIWAMEQGL